VFAIQPELKHHRVVAFFMQFGHEGRLSHADFVASTSTWNNQLVTFSCSVMSLC